MTYKIDKSLPIPPRKWGSGGKAKYPWVEMNAGDSFEVNLADSNCRTISSLRGSLARCARDQFGTGNFETRITGDGVRVWRIR